MPTGPETLLYQRLRDNLPPECRITRIESRVGLGLPDCWVAVARRGIALLELKVVKRGKKVNLSPHQIAFHVTHGAMQIPCFVLVQYHPPKAPTIRGAQWLLYRSDQVMDLVREGVDLAPAASWPADGVRWHMLKDELMTY